MNQELEQIKKYCLNCINKPCSNGCPLYNDIPKFIHEKDTQKAFDILCDTTVIPAICGRICPYNKQCERSCTRGIKGTAVDIGKAETLIGDISIKNDYKIPLSIDASLKEKKVAIVGGGPAGLTAAAFLARKGINVTIYERYNKLGGILMYGIPNFRLPKEVVNNTVDKILGIGNIEVKYNKELQKNIFLTDLLKEYDSIFLAFGANVSSKMGIEGENLNGVYGANEVLEHNTKIDFKNKNVAVIGGGNVAMDMARTAIKYNPKSVTVIYRRSEEQMPAEKNEIKESKNDGINFLFQNNVINIIENNNVDKQVEKIECVKTELIKREGEDRLVPINIDDSNYYLDMDFVFMAVGSKTEDSVVKNLKIKLNKYNNVEVDKNFRTSNEKIFAGGDLIGEKSTVAWAARSGREAAKSIIAYLGQF